MIHQQFKNALAEAGLEEVDATGQTVRPEPATKPSRSRKPPNAPEGQVVQQLRKGYKLRDRLLRPASVIVARKPPEQMNESKMKAPALPPPAFAISF